MSSQCDTGSSILVVETDSFNICTSTPDVCTRYGACKSISIGPSPSYRDDTSYTGVKYADDANSSSTYQYVNSDMVVAYGGGDSTTGDFAKDIMSLGDAAIPVEFGIMYKSTVGESVFGSKFQCQVIQ